MTRTDDTDPETVIVTVVRTGGIAGMRRQWVAEPPADEASHWIALLRQCPWDEARSREARGADRFAWRIRARCDADEREAELTDTEVRGPWRTLVDEVRANAAPRASAPR